MRASQRKLSYLAIGHVTQDLASSGETVIGGTVSYAARTARTLGYQVRIITSARSDLELQQSIPDTEILLIPAPATTTFENRISAQGRSQTILATAHNLTPEVVPPEWRTADVVHIGPVAQECAPELVGVLSAFVGLTPQGWMRRWDEKGRVTKAEWGSVTGLLPLVDAVVLSQEDLGGDTSGAESWASKTRLLAITRGAAGCTIYTDGHAYDVPGFAAQEIDSTGAGDIFAAVLFTQLQQGIPPWEAARLANWLAAKSVARIGLDGTPTPAEVALGTRLCISEQQ